MNDHTITLDNGVAMPALGFGVFQTAPEETRRAVARCEVGYRHIDTAAAYGNEREVGEAVRASTVDRAELFVETKVWISDYGYEETLHGFEKSAGKLGVDRIDLLILHQALPSEFARTLEAYRALETLLEDGKGGHRCQQLHGRALDNGLGGSRRGTGGEPDRGPPLLPARRAGAERRARNRHPGVVADRWHHVLPRGGAHTSTLEDPTIVGIAGAHAKSPAQVMLRWHLQQGRSAIPKSTKPHRIAENWVSTSR